MWRGQTLAGEGRSGRDAPSSQQSYGRLSARQRGSGDRQRRGWRILGAHNLHGWRAARMGDTCSALRDSLSLFSSASIFCNFFLTSRRRCAPKRTKPQDKIPGAQNIPNAHAQLGANTPHGFGGALLNTFELTGPLSRRAETAGRSKSTKQGWILCPTTRFPAHNLFWRKCVSRVSGGGGSAQAHLVHRLAVGVVVFRNRIAACKQICRHLVSCLRTPTAREDRGVCSPVRHALPAR